ncbi:MAG TPA: MFS transporter [Steroidobacteraceae bacterium]|nr:MFS transporter [Steroidobacteraceae bacterium]
MRAFLFCALIILLDGYDLQAMALAVPTLAAHWHLPASAFAPALSASLVGLGLGSALLAPLGDRIGRRPLLVGGMLLMAVTGAGAACADGVGQLVLWRALIGAALGVCQANATALASEHAPPARRAGVMTLVGCSVSLGGMLAGWAAPWILAQATWRGLFLVGAVLPAGIAVAALAGLPESPQLPAGRPAAANPGALASLRALLAPAYRERTLRLWCIYGLAALLLYLLTSWLPVLLSSAGWPAARALRGIALLQFGGIAGALIQAWWIDRGHPVGALIGAYAVTAAAAAAFAVPGAQGAWPLLLVLLGSGAAGAMLSIFAVGAIYYPPAIRVSGFGWAGAITRVGAVLGPLLGGWVLGTAMPAAHIMALMALPAALCCVLAVGMRRTLRLACRMG